MGAIKKRAAKALMIREEEILSLEILRRSLDCRKKPEIFYVYSVEVQVKDEEKVLLRAKKNPKAKEQFSISDQIRYQFPKPVELKEGTMRPVIAGAGPAGLFCAYILALAGLKPILLERGSCVEERTRDVEQFWQTGKLLPNSNVQFGEGGAGTFSDGKLNTLVKDKNGRNRAVLETFVRFGAKESILYDAKPHIGTDVLAKVIRNMREELLRLGADVRFHAQVTGIELKDGEVCALRLHDGERLACKDLVLAIGHSARDTFEMLDAMGLAMEPKPFAVGFRVEHPQEMINESQYGDPAPEGLEAAAYKVTAKAKNGRAVYSFCMCPGGYVVNASSEEGRLAVNGMSYSGRDGKNANSAIIVAVSPEDYPGEGPLSGITFQRELEEKAYRLGEGKIPVQRYGDYKNHILEINENVALQEGFEPCMKGEYKYSDLSQLLPKECGKAIIDGMTQFGRQISGFDREDAILSGVESRTSSPVRILRDDFCEAGIRGIYPCGEGAGYAGGITSAAMDGLKVGEVLIKRLTN